MPLHKSIFLNMKHKEDSKLAAAAAQQPEESILDEFIMRTGNMSHHLKAVHDAIVYHLDTDAWTEGLQDSLYFINELRDLVQDME